MQYRDLSPELQKAVDAMVRDQNAQPPIRCAASMGRTSSSSICRTFPTCRRLTPLSRSERDRMAGVQTVSIVCPIKFQLIHIGGDIVKADHRVSVD